MESMSPLQIAQKTFTPLATILTNAREKWDMDLIILGASLGASLGALSLEINGFTPQQQIALENNGRIEEALKMLENMISAHSPTTTRSRIPSRPRPSSIRSRLPILHTLAEAQISFEEASHETRDAALTVLNDLGKNIQERLLRPASKANLKKLLELVQTFSEIKTNESPDFIDPVDEAADENPEHRSHATALYNVLTKHAVSHCPESDESQQHWAKLRLTLTQHADQENVVPFDMLFSASPDPSRHAVCEWQDVQVLVSSPRRKRVTIFDESSSLSAEGSMMDDSRAVEDREFCTLISSQYGSRLCFRVADEQLRLLADSPEIEHDIQSTQGATLGAILADFKLTFGMRPILAYNIAKSVWQYYNSDWMNTVWTGNRISFMEMGEDKESCHFFKPYISIEFESRDKESSEYFKSDGAMHRFPRVLALGMMLLEIATGKPTGIEGHEDPHHWDALTVNKQCRKLKAILDNAEFESDCNFPRYRIAVAKCLDFRLFRSGVSGPKKAKQNIKERQSILYREVVDSLRQLVEGAGWNLQYEEMEKTPIELKKTSKVLPLSSSLLQNQQSVAYVPVLQSQNRYEALVQHDVCPKYLRIRQSRPSASSNEQNWFRNINLVNDIIKRKTRVSGMHSCKIAILDTGCDANAPSLSLPGRKRIRRWKDFVEESMFMIDENGHGTHLTTLIQQMAPYAEVCVMRVAKHSEGLQSAKENIVKAIEIAVREWDVDFVSMSFGFPTRVQIIEDAISATYVHKKSVTFFAAANNDGFNSREMFPANLGGSVLSMRGTNMHGGFEQKFNPPRSSPEPVFGTFGVNVYSDWTGQEDARSMSGSSVATAVAVGIASMMIEYATRSGDFTPEELQLMRTRRGISEIFLAIGECGHSGDDHYYVAPFEFFRGSDKDRLAKIRTAISKHPAYC